LWDLIHQLLLLAMIVGFDSSTAFFIYYAQGAILHLQLAVHQSTIRVVSIG
jgi:hypothetical protein